MARVIAGTSPEQRNKLMVVAAVAFAAIAAILVFVALQNRDGGGGAGAATTTEVVVAKQDIAVNTRLTEGMLETKSVSAEQALNGVYGDAERAVGLPARFPIQSGEQVTASKVGLSVIEDEKDLALVLDAGQRGFSVQVTEVTGVGGLLLPGNFVDVIAVFPEGPAGLTNLGEITTVEDIQDIKAITLLQNVEVLGVAQEAQEPIPAAVSGDDPAETGNAEAVAGIQGQRPEDVERQPGARSVTLAVTPQQVQLLALVQETNGVIWLSLRPVGDAEPVPADETNLVPLISAPFPGE